LDQRKLKGICYCVVFSRLVVWIKGSTISFPKEWSAFLNKMQERKHGVSAKGKIPAACLVR